MLTPAEALASLTEEQQQLFQKIFLQQSPMVDLRSPSEFTEGAFPTSVNIPLMTDDQRAEVGTTYKKLGQDAAIRLGHQLVSGASRDALLAEWQAFFQAHDDAYLYCFRGGLRSRTVAAWLADSGLNVPLIPGGYKAMRRYLVGMTALLSEQQQVVVIGGQTGSAKTHYLNTWRQGIDLEGLANHRGSSFGRRATPQPTVINFENAVAVAMLQNAQHSSRILVEDEGVTIGSCSLPLALRTAMQAAPLVLLDVDFEQRRETILADYVIDLSREYQELDPDHGEAHYQEAMLAALSRIRKRLGGVLYEQLHELMQRALSHADSDLHRQWISVLLEQYYDPMYRYQISKKQQRTVFQGSPETVTEYLQSLGYERL